MLVFICAAETDEVENVYVVVLQVQTSLREVTQAGGLVWTQWIKLDTKQVIQ